MGETGVFWLEDLTMEDLTMEELFTGTADDRAGGCTFGSLITAWRTAFELRRHAILWIGDE